MSLNQVIQLDKEIAQKAANIYSNLRLEGRLIGHNDVLIAATAIVHKMKLITNNTEHFGRISELEIDNWVI